MGCISSAVPIICQRRCCAQNQHSVQTTQNVDSEEMLVILTNKMGRWYRLLFLRTSPNQQKGSLRRTETTNLTVTEQHAHQQICLSAKWVDNQDCCFWPPFTFLVSPTGTKWGSVPICRAITRFMMNVVIIQNF